MAVDDYDGSEGTLLFGAPAGKEYSAYLRALLPEALEEARSLGFSTLVAHWRAGWASAQQVLLEHDFVEAAPGLWRCAL
jgi:hypothetical protein